MRAMKATTRCGICSPQRAPRKRPRRKALPKGRGNSPAQRSTRRPVSRDHRPRLLPDFWDAFAWPLFSMLLLAGCSSPERRSAPTAQPLETTEWFVDRARASGLDFVHVNGMSGGLYLAEIMGAGV